MSACCRRVPPSNPANHNRAVRAGGRCHCACHLGDAAVQARPARLPDTVDAFARILTDTEHWSGDTLDQLVQVVLATGRRCAGQDPDAEGAASP